MTQDEEHNLARVVIRRAGGPTAVAERVGLLQSAVSNWISRNRIPREHCATVEAMAGMRFAEQMHDDICWTRGTDGQITGYHVPVSLLTGPTAQQPSESGA